MIRKTLIAAAAAIALLATPAYALTQFYDWSSGQWRIEGYYGKKEFCSAKTYWDNGSYVSLFNMRGSDIFSLYVHNVAWDMAGDYGAYYDGIISFDGRAGSGGGPMSFELKDPQTIIIRNLTNDFLRNWIEFREMTIIMPNGISDMRVGLVGTADAVNAFANCIDMLNGN